MTRPSLSRAGFRLSPAETVPVSIDYLAAGNRDAPVLLMLHGIGGGAECFRPQLDFFSDDYHAVAWNMPGYGASPALKRLTFEALSGAVGQLLEELEATRVHIVGHSIGGMVAQQFAADYPDKLLSLTLVATSAAFGGRDGEFQRRFLEERLGPLDRGATMAQLADTIVDSLIGEAPDGDRLAIARRCMAAVSEASYRASMECLVTFDLRKELGKIRVPTLLISGEKDTNAPPPVMEKMAGFIPGARYRCLEKAGHLIPLEQPAVFNKTLNDFLDSIEKPI